MTRSRALAWLFEVLSRLEPGVLLALSLGLVAFVSAMAFLLQAVLRTAIARSPRRTAPLAAWDALLSWPLLLVAALVGWFRLARRLLAWSTRATAAARRVREAAANVAHAASVDTGDAGDAGDALTAPDPDADAPEEPVPYLAQTLGPSYALAAVVTAGLWLVARLTEPLAALRLGLDPATPVWSLLALGDEIALLPYLPLQAHPALAALLAVAVWSTVWSLIARCLRLVWHRELALGAGSSGAATRRWWHEAFGLREANTENSLAGLTRPCAAYRRWAWPTLSVLGAGLAATWPLLPASWWPAAPSAWGLGLVVCQGWGLHLALRGAHRDPAPAEPVRKPVPIAPPGWADVLAELAAAHGTPAPVPAKIFPTQTLPTATRRTTVPTAPALSPLLRELAGPLRPMQQRELERLAGEEIDRLVLAPEGWGKTELGILIACREVLDSGRAALLVARDANGADALERRLRARLEQATARWTLRLRRLGGASDDLVEDLASGVPTDLLVTDLQGLTTLLLARLDPHRPFLRRIGRVVIDDADAYLGPVEVHARLAFRRLHRAIERASGRSARCTVLATGGMDRADAWLRELVGLDATTAIYASQVSGSERVHERVAPRRELYPASALRDGTGRPLPPEAIVAACERLGVAWHWRSRSGSGGPPARLLDATPQHAAPVSDAAVVFFDGPWSAVRREIERLPLAGAARSRHPEAREAAGEAIALLSLVEPAEAAAFEDDGGATSRPLAALPRPLLHGPGASPTVQAHLGASLSQDAEEVDVVVRLFGRAVAGRLRDLARAGWLHVDERTRVADDAPRFVREAWVRIAGAAVGSSDRGGAQSPRITDVESLAGPRIRLLDRATGHEIATVDAAVAPFVAYAGALIDRGEQRFRVAEPLDPTHAATDDLWLESTLAAGRSVPRRRMDAVGDPETPPIPLTWLRGAEPIRLVRGRGHVYLVHHGAAQVPRFATSEGADRGRSVVHIREPGQVAPPLDTAIAWLRCAPLDLDATRLLAAALRPLVPNLLRGAARRLDLEVTTWRDPMEPRSEHGEPAILFFDLQEGGNGCLRAFEHDGIDQALDLARSLLRAGVDLPRLVALHDSWHGEPLDDLDPLRQTVLTWLDARLPNDGPPATRSPS